VGSGKIHVGATLSSAVRRDLPPSGIKGESRAQRDRLDLSVVRRLKLSGRAAAGAGAGVEEEDEEEGEVYEMIFVEGVGRRGAKDALARDLCRIEVSDSVWEGGRWMNS